MAKNFKELQAKMSPERRARNEAAAAKMIDEMALDELREARDLTQEQLARLLHVNQAAVSKMERRADMYITTLQRVIKAMGGRLEIGYLSEWHCAHQPVSGLEEASVACLPFNHAGDRYEALGKDLGRDSETQNRG